MLGAAGTMGILSDNMLVCATCGKRYTRKEVSTSQCPECGGHVRPSGLLASLAQRWVSPREPPPPEPYHRHVQMIQSMWSADGRGQEYYRIVGAPVSYSTFLNRVTALVCRGIEEGWIEVVVPRAPVRDESAYQIRFLDPERFADEVFRLFH